MIKKVVVSYMNMTNIVIFAISCKPRMNIQLYLLNESSIILVTEDNRSNSTAAESVTLQIKIG
jgi:hypothetical protein